MDVVAVLVLDVVVDVAEMVVMVADVVVVDVAEMVVMVADVDVVVDVVDGVDAVVMGGACHRG